MQKDAKSKRSGKNMKNLYLYNQILDTRISVRLSSSVTPRLPPMKRGGLESSGQRLISSNGKTKEIAFFFFFLRRKNIFLIFQFFEKSRFFWLFLDFFRFSDFFTFLGPVDNRPSTDQLHHFVQQQKFIYSAKFTELQNQ